MEKKWFIGVDLGGTITKLAIVDEDGEVIKKWEIETDTSEEGKHITPNIANSIKEQLQVSNYPTDRIAAIGVGAPCFLEMATGYVHRGVNLGWKDYPFREHLEAETGYAVSVDNDANTYAIGEMWKGAGNKSKNVLCITLGTGIGGGIISNGQILHGVNGMAGEIGHITSIIEGGAQCNCGKTGCLETIASATGIARLATEGLAEHPTSMLVKRMEEQGRLTAKDVFDAVNEKDDWALLVLDTVMLQLGLAIANLANTLNPQRIVIGGGVAKAGQALLQPLEEQFERFALPRVRDGAEFAIAQLGNDAGVIGAAWIAKEQINKKVKLQ